MTLLPLLRSSLSSALERQYLTEKWIGDQSLVTILQKHYNLEFVAKSYINKYLPNIYLNNYNCYHIRINGIKDNRKKKINAYFYYFSKSKLCPSHLSTKLQWEQAYNNFRTLRNLQNRKRKPPLIDITNINNNSISKQGNDLQKIRKEEEFIKNVIVNYFNSPEAKLLFKNKEGESVEECISRRIDMFDEILNNRKDISLLVNKAGEKNCEMNNTQFTLMTHRMHYLRNAYLQLLNVDTSKPISFQECCEEAIKKMNEVGIRTITNSKTVMQWNRIFRVNENFPHPNIFIEMDKTYRSPFLDTFPEAKLQIIQWGKENIGNISCESVMMHLREK